MRRWPIGVKNVRDPESGQLARHEIGDQAGFEVSRHGVTSRVFVTLGESPNSFVHEHGDRVLREYKLRRLEEKRDNE